tara:strand:- start:873 stop:1139 length:267 start_codon:yes stop_codon:yes gene_type:complete
MSEFDDYESLKEAYDVLRRDCFIARVGYAKGIELVNLILNPGGFGSVETCALEFRRAVKSAQGTLDQIDAGDEELSKYMAVKSLSELP